MVEKEWKVGDTFRTVKNAESWSLWIGLANTLRLVNYRYDFDMPGNAEGHIIRDAETVKSARLISYAKPDIVAVQVEGFDYFTTTDQLIPLTENQQEEREGKGEKNPSPPNLNIFYMQSPSRVDRLSTLTFELRDGQSFEMPLSGRWNLKELTHYSTWLPPWVHKYHPDPCRLEIANPDWIALEGGRPHIEVIPFCRAELQIWLKDMGPVLALGKAKIISRSYWTQITEPPKAEDSCSGSQILKQYLW